MGSGNAGNSYRATVFQSFGDRFEYHIANRNRRSNVVGGIADALESISLAMQNKAFLHVYNRAMKDPRLIQSINFELRKNKDYGVIVVVHFWYNYAMGNPYIIDILAYVGASSISLCDAFQKSKNQASILPHHDNSRHYVAYIWISPVSHAQRDVTLELMAENCCAVQSSDFRPPP